MALALNLRGRDVNSERSEGSSRRSHYHIFQGVIQALLTISPEAWLQGCISSVSSATSGLNQTLRLIHRYYCITSKFAQDGSRSCLVRHLISTYPGPRHSYPSTFMTRHSYVTTGKAPNNGLILTSVMWITQLVAMVRPSITTVHSAGLSQLHELGTRIAAEADGFSDRLP